MERRAFLSGTAAAAACLLAAILAGARSAPAADGGPIRAIVVDSRPLEARGASGAAAILRAQLQESLKREFAGRIGKGGPTLVVRLQTVYLGAYAGGGGGLRPTGSSDYLEGDVTLGDRHFPLLVTQDSSAGGAWYLPDNDVRRLRALANQFAGWVRRKV